MEQEEYKEDYVKVVCVIKELKPFPPDLRKCRDPNDLSCNESQFSGKVYSSFLLPLPHLFFFFNTIDLNVKSAAYVKVELQRLL